jgi:hypothetical protein
MTTEEIVEYSTVALAGATVLLFLATAVLVSVAFVQLRAERRKHLEIETLRICSQLDTDPVIHAASKRIWQASGGGKSYHGNVEIDQHDVITCANFIDGIATGILQGTYSGEIAEDHIGPFVKKYGDIIIPAIFGDFSDYGSLKQVYDLWFVKSPSLKYQVSKKNGR